MRQTRSSARLAKAAKSQLDEGVASTSAATSKKILPGVKEEAGNNDSDFGEITDKPEDTKEEDEEFEEKETVAPKRKRARTARVTKSAPRKRQVRGRQGRLEGLMKMPIDIFTEIALHLMPKDIIMLSRSNKFFRKLLMSRSAIHLWHGTMRNVPGLPPCPPDLSEPHYLALIYARNCSKDVDEVQARLDEFDKSDDQVALAKWKETRRQELDVRRKQASELTQFLDTIDESREAELSGLKRQRTAEVQRRLLELGWEKEDLTFPYYRRRDWEMLVDQPKPLTDRTWENLRPKLVPLLEANREDRLKQEKAARR
ncbi:hypothetical protein FRC09_000400, partial [Ceratobasidium sp. 395]